MNTEGLEALLARVKGANVPDRELDAQLATLMLGFQYVPCTRPSEGFVWRNADGNLEELPHLTASIDAALAMVDRVLPGWGYRLAKSRSGSCTAEFWPGTSFDHNREKRTWGNAGTAPLAILTALLTALIAGAAS